MHFCHPFRWFVDPIITYSDVWAASALSPAASQTITSRLTSSKEIRPRASACQLSNVVLLFFTHSVISTAYPLEIFLIMIVVNKPKGKKDEWLLTISVKKLRRPADKDQGNGCLKTTTVNLSLTGLT